MYVCGCFQLEIAAKAEKNRQENTEQRRHSLTYCYGLNGGGMKLIEFWIACGDIFCARPIYQIIIIAVIIIICGKPSE